VKVKNAAKADESVPALTWLRDQRSSSDHPRVTRILGTSHGYRAQHNDFYGEPGYASHGSHGRCVSGAGSTRQ
jgi:hypothetical protein